MKTHPKNIHHPDPTLKRNGTVKNIFPKKQNDEDDEVMEEEDDYTKVDKEDNYIEPTGPTKNDLKNSNLFIEDDDDDDDDDPLSD